MDIAKIESFLLLVKQQNFAKTADLLFVSQPALTKRIASLEDELGVPLFNRMGNKTYLTTEGEAFKPFAEQILATYNNAKESIRQIESMEYGTLNFGTTNFIGVYLIPQIISKFHEIYPNITINMVINSSTNIIDMLHKNQLEFVFLSDYIELDENQYVIKDYAQDHLKLIVGNKHPLYHHKTCHFTDIENDLYITKKKSSSQYKFLEEIFEEFNFDFKNKLYISAQDAIKESVVNNLGVSIMSEKAVEREIRDGLIHSLEFKEKSIDRKIRYVYIKNKHLTPSAKAFLSLVDDKF